MIKKELNKPITQNHFNTGESLQLAGKYSDL